MARTIFGNEIDYSRIRIFDHRWWLGPIDGRPHAPDGNIYYPQGYSPDFSAIKHIGIQQKFIHELAHVWQHQNGYDVPKNVLNSSSYDYNQVFHGTSFFGMGLEAQAEMIGHYYYLKNGGVLTPEFTEGHPVQPIGEYERFLPPEFVPSPSVAPAPSQSLEHTPWDAPGTTPVPDNSSIVPYAPISYDPAVPAVSGWGDVGTPVGIEPVSSSLGVVTPGTFEQILSPGVVAPSNIQPVKPPELPQSRPEELRPDITTGSPLAGAGGGLGVGGLRGEDRNDRASNGYGAGHYDRGPSSAQGGGTAGAPSSGGKASSGAGHSSSGGYARTPSEGPTPSARPDRGNSPGDTAKGNGYGGGGSYRGNGPGRSPTGKSDTRGRGGDITRGERGNGTSEVGVPVLLDLAGNGLDINPLSSSSKFVETDGDGYERRTAWAGAGNGILVIDLGGDGKVTEEREFAFTHWNPGAGGDLAALKSVFDTNGNGKLDAGDARWNEFKVMVDDQLVSLSSLGIESIDLTPTGTGRVFSDGSAITGTTTFTRTDGTQGAVGDAILASDSRSYAIKRNSVANADGSTTSEVSGFDKAGVLAFRELITVSADRATTITKFDDDGNGTYDRQQSVALTVAADNSRTTVVSNFAADGSLTDRTTTTTRADKRLVTTLLDLDGDGVTDKRQIFKSNADGSTSTTVEVLSASGAVLTRIVMDASTDGLSKTTSTDLTGGGVYHFVRTEATIVAVDGTRTSTVTEASDDGTLLSKSVEVTSANGQLKTIDIDSNGDGRFDERQVITTEVGEGFYTTTTEIFNEDGTLRSSGSTFTNLDGKQKSLQFDRDGDGVFESRASETSWDSNGFRYESVSRRGPADKYSSTSVVGPGGATRLIVEDSNGDGKPDRRVQVVSSTQQTTTSTQMFNRAGAVIATESITAFNDGSRLSTSLDRDGDGVFEAFVEQTTTSGDDGERITWITSRSGFGPSAGVTGSTIRTVSADGLTTDLMTDIDGNDRYERSTREVNVVQQDGSRTKRTTVHSNQGAKLSSVEATVSADRKTLTMLEDADGDGQTDRQQVSVNHLDGRKSVVSSLLAAGSTIQRTSSTRSADGLRSTTDVDADGNGSTDLTTTEDTQINADGSRIQSLAQFAGNGKLLSKSTTKISGNGLTSESTGDRNGDGIVDLRGSDTTVLNANGSRTRTISSSVDGSITTTVSASGLIKTTVVDADGNGNAERTISDQTVIAGDLSATNTVSATNGAGQLLSKTTTITASDRNTSSASVDSDGDGFDDRTVSAQVEMSGGTTTTVSTFKRNGTQSTLSSRATTRVSANGLSTTQLVDLDGDGTVDRKLEIAKALKSDGSVEERITEYHANGSRKSETITKVLRGGVEKTTEWRSDGTTTSRTATESRVYADDGSVVDTVVMRKGDGVLESKTINSVSGNKRTTITTRDIDGDGTIDQVAKSVLQADGSLVTTYDDLAVDGIALGARRTVTISANGMSKTTELDIDGDGTADQRFQSITVLKADGGKTETITEYGADLVARARSVSNSSWDGLAVEEKWDVNGDGAFERSRNRVVQLNADSSSAETVSQFDGASLRARYLSSSSANGLVKTKQWDLNGDGSIDENLSDTTTLNLDGTTTRTVQAFEAGISLSSSTTTTSSDGLTATTQEKRSHAGAEADRTLRSNKVVLADGTVVETRSVFNAVNQLREQQRTTVSGNGLEIKIERDTEGDGDFDQVETRSQAVDGSKRTVIANFADNGAKFGVTTVLTAADGRTTSIDWDEDAGGSVDRRRLLTENFNADGSYESVAVDTRGNGVAASRTHTRTSADGSTRTIARDLNGDGVADVNEVSVTDIRGETVVTTTSNAEARSAKYLTQGDVYWSQAIAAKTELTVASDGLTRTMRSDYDGDGTFEHFASSRTQIDGSVVTAITERDSGGNVVARGLSTVTVDGNTTILKKDANNDGRDDRVETSFQRSDGSVTHTIIENGSDGSLRQTTRNEVNALGRRTLTIVTDTQGRKLSEHTFRLDGSSTKCGFDGFSGELLWTAEFSTDGTQVSGVLLDPLNEKSWARVEQSFDSAGVKAFEKLFNDDGTTQENRFNPTTGKITDVQTFAANGALTSKTAFDAQGKPTSTVLYDPLNQSVWSRVEQTFDQTGAKTLEKQYNDDGTRQENRFNPATGKITEVQTFAANGSLTSKTVFDVQGKPTSTVLYDPLNQNPWSRVEQSFDQTGAKTLEKQFHDDGTTQEHRFNPTTGKVTEVQTFTAAGALTSKTLFDAQGKTASTILYDPLDQQIWSRVEQTFDPVGVKTLEKQFNDDGTRAEIFYRSPSGKPYEAQNFASNGTLLSKTFYDTAGIKTSAVIYDPFSQNAWSRVEQTFDAAGVKTIEKQFNDNGTRVEVFYRSPSGKQYESQNFGADGNLDSKTFYDVAGVRTNAVVYDPRNQASWSRVEQTFDAAQVKTVEKQFGDDGTRAEFFYRSPSGVVYETRNYTASGSLLSKTFYDTAGKKTSAVVYDVASQNGWSRAEQTFDAAGVKTLEKQFQDNGTRTDLYFRSPGGQLYEAQVFSTSGVLTSKTEYDALSNQAWSRREHIIDAQGRTTQTSVFNDDGTKRVDHFDATSAQSWSTIASYYNAAGQLYFVDQANDNGTRSTINYDVSNSQGWSRYEQLKDSAGRVLSQTNFNDDGTRTTYTYDPTNAQAWSLYQQNYNAAGQLTSVDQTNDNGTHNTIHYDVANNQGWSRYEQYIDGSGRVLNQANFNDDGTKHVYQFDPANTQTWTKITQVYNAAGALEWQANEFDNGVTETTTFNVNNNKPWARFVQTKNAGGSLTSEAAYQNDSSRYVKFWDPGNAETWSQLEQYVDAAGTLTAQLKRLDNGSVEELRFNGQGTARQIATFDADFYVAANPDIAAGWHAPPIEHYNQFGWKEGRKPNAWFDGNYYLQQNPDVKNAGLNPFEHWRVNGYAEGRSPFAGYQRFDGRAQTDLAGISDQQFSQMQLARIDEMRRAARDVINWWRLKSPREWPRSSADSYQIAKSNEVIRSDNRTVLGMYPEYAANRFRPANLSNNNNTGGGGRGDYYDGISRPVVLDLDRDDHLDLRPFHPNQDPGASAPRFDWDGDGVRDLTGWAGPTDGLLAIDLAADGSAGGDGFIDQAKELGFSLWKTPEEINGEQEVVTDLEGLRHAFDTNGNFMLDEGDARWSEFRIWRDLNQDGLTDAGELQTLAEADIRIIELVPSMNGGSAFADGSQITGISSYLKADGTKALVGDAEVGYRPSRQAAVA
ncbi:hypothetical protein LAC81_25770 [Ensifer adhaerens]|uniref:hypothetical protein n=1 Tax=Ensifer adhaerens TaxID=106592 RepID=UPI001CBBB5B8|nr:hypothetical protein [Ensifer adhaerens]MBZ7927765.1 hypothetical protein [Ensifer adhaerens]UAX96600.1 hypothetical protein LAC78_22715 [Ensifer adhaerens]UAY04056.1 hypothetical protein LAC80_22245 [Ensifer adhaerens]UAY12042.1 hypothetical protein LAC81_25770 [Ensifer adhaerens]